MSKIEDEPDVLINDGQDDWLHLRVDIWTTFWQSHQIADIQKSFMIRFPDRENSFESIDFMKNSPDEIHWSKEISLEMLRQVEREEMPSQDPRNKRFQTNNNLVRCI